MAETLDLRKQLGALYAPSPKAPTLIDAPRLQILSLAGEGDPASAPQWQSAVETLYSLAYALKFALRKAGVADYAVMPLEAFWWVADGGVYSPTAPREAWRWKACIVQPDFVSQSHVDDLRDSVARKKPSTRPHEVLLEVLEEGRVAQLLHQGPYADELPNINRLHAFIEAQGLRPRGNHHEIYLSDPQRTAPARMKTILRHAVEPNP